MVEQPITTLSLTNLGPFESVEMTFSPQVNVIVGTNNTGKSLLLRTLYAMTSVASEKSNPVRFPPDEDMDGLLWPTAVRDKLCGVFNVDTLRSLTTHGRQQTHLTITLGDDSDLHLRFPGDDPPGGTHSIKVGLAFHRPRAFPVFLPAHEILSVAPGLRSLYATYEVPFDETWNDLAELLYRPRLKGRSGTSVEDAVTEVMGGRFEVDGDRFVLRRSGSDEDRLEAPLVSEGHRKLGMLQVLLSNGVLRDQGYLFWDEPEANLNPATIRALAPLVARLAAHGVQVFLATHSLFLLRELQMLDEDGAADIRYTGLDREESGAVVAVQADDLDDLPVLTALDAELEQSSRYLYR